MKMRGVSGQLRVGGRVAADLGAWTAERRDEGTVVEADALASNPLLLGQGPAELRLVLGSKLLCWRGAAVEGTGAGPFRIVVQGPPELR